MYFHNPAQRVATKWLIERCKLPSSNRVIPLVCSGEKTAQCIEQQTLLKAVRCQGKSFSATSRQRHNRKFQRQWLIRGRELRSVRCAGFLDSLVRSVSLL